MAGVSALAPSARSQANDAAAAGTAEEQDVKPLTNDPDVAAGWDAQAEGDYAKALALWRKAADRGIAAAYEGLGVLHWDGQGVKPSTAEAKKLFESGAKLGDPRPMLRLAQLLLNEDNNFDEALAWANRAASASPMDSPEYERALSFMQNAEASQAQHAAEAEEAAEKTALAQDQRPGADDFRAGLAAFESRKFDVALAAFRKAAVAGHPLSFRLLGIMHDSGYATAKNLEEARRLYAAGATKGDPAAMLALAYAWRNGRGGPEDPAQAKYWFQQADSSATLSRSQRADASNELSQLEDLVAATTPRPLPAPQSLASPTAQPAAVAQTRAPHPAPASPLLPPALTTDAAGLLVLPPRVATPESPIALERALREGWAAAPSTNTATKSRGLALARYATALLAIDLPEASKTALIRERVDELALLDFRALLEAQSSISGSAALEFAQQYITDAQRADLAQPAAFPAGRGWADADLTAAQQALAAKNFPLHLASLQKAAAKGSPAAMVSLAAAYRDGTGVAADPVQAARWLHFATTKNHGPAMLELANALEAGKGIAANANAARGWRTTARGLRPVSVAQRRIDLSATPAQFRSYLLATWAVDIRLNNGKALTTHFKFGPATGTTMAALTNFTLTAESRSNQPLTIPVTTTAPNGQVFNLLHFDFLGANFTGGPDGAVLRGGLKRAGAAAGTWSAVRRIDLDYFDLGYAALQARRLEDAIHYLTQAIAARPEALYFSNRGNAYYAAFDTEPAIADYNEALRLAPQDQVVLYNRVLAHHYSGKHAEAIADATRLLTLNPPVPNRAATHRMRALEHYRLGDYEPAQKDFAESRRLNPEQQETREEAIVAMQVASAATNKAMNELSASAAKMAAQLGTANQAMTKTANSANATASKPNSTTPPTTTPTTGAARPSLDADLDALEAARLFAAAFKEYQAQNFGAAFKGFTAAAALGQTTAMFNLGVMHEQGQGTAKNFEEAVAWFEKAAAAGHEKATPEFIQSYRVRLDFHRGLTAYNAKDFPVAFASWKKAADAGNTNAMFNLSILHERGEGTEADPAAALAWIEKAVAAGYKQPVDASTKRLKGRIAGAAEYKQADAAEKANELVAARSWYEKAAAAGNVLALARLGYFYQYGVTVVADEKKAQEFYQRAADGGDEFSGMQLDVMKSSGSMRDLLESQREMKRLARSIDGQAPAKVSALSTATPTQAEIDALIKKSPWTVAEIRAALQRGVKHRALAVAISTDKMTDFYDSDYQQLLATPEMQHREDYDRLNMVLIENRKPGAGPWARDAALAAVTARRAQLASLPPRPVDSADLRAKALAGDAAALYAVIHLGEKRRTLGPLSPELTKKSAELKTLVQQQQFKPAYWLLADGLVYNADKSKENLAQAVAYYRASAEAGDARGAEKLAQAFIAPGEVGAARNYLEAEQWFIEAAARGTDEDFAGMKPEFALTLLYSYVTPIGFTGMSMPTDDDALRWARELFRRGGKFAEHAKLSLVNQGKELNNTDLLGRLAALAPEVPPFPAAELAKLETAARAGDVPALLKLADAYATGRGVRQHDIKALEYFQQAAAQDSAPAMRRLAQIYVKGHGVKPDEATRIAWLRKAGEAGDAKAWMEIAPLLKGSEMLATYEKAAALGEKDALQRLANAYRYGWGGIPKDGQKFIAAMQQAIAAGYLGGYADIARYYEGERDKPNALAWLRKAVEAGDKNSRDELASALFSAKEKDAARAVYLDLANDGNVHAQMMVAAMLGEAGDADGAEKWYRQVAAGPASDDQKRAARFAKEYAEERTAAPGTLPYFRRLAQKGDLDAMVQFARLLAPTDRTSALNWIRRAADGGHAPATSMYIGELAKMKREDAIGWAKAAAEKGNTQAQLFFALELAATDKPAALAGIEKVANAGNAEAKYRLGMMLFNGAEMAKDAPRGLALVQESADAGFAAAQTDYGRALVVGIPGVTAAPATGLGYLEKAAAQQFPQALMLLGEIYERGAGVAANPRKALEYYQAAQKLGVTQVAPAVQRLQLQLSGKMPPPKPTPAPIKK